MVDGLARVSAPSTMLRMVPLPRCAVEDHRHRRGPDRPGAL